MKTNIIKQITIVLCFLMFTPLLVKGQEIDNSYNTPPHELNYMYLKKHKTQKTIGWICLGSGAVMILGGLAINSSQGWGEGNQNNGLWLSYLGAGVVLTSVPLFISAGSNKRKAEIALKKETVSMGIFEKTNNYSLSVTIPF